MSSGKRFTSVVSMVLSAIGSAAIIAAVALGLSGWPPAKASAAPPATQGVLGIGDQVSGPATQLRLAEKVGNEPESQVESLPAPVERATAPVPNQGHATPSRPAGPAGKLAALPAGWRRARVSWYGPGFYGHTMAGGGNLRPQSMIVAHRRLPFGTRIEFSYKGRTVQAVVRDRGPFVGGREFDLGPGTARALGFGGVGVVSYRVVGS